MRIQFEQETSYMASSFEKSRCFVLPRVSFCPGLPYVCSMDLWFLLGTVCCTCCKRSDTQHSLLCSLCSVSVLQWRQKMTSQCQQRLSFCSIDIFFCRRVDIHHFGCHHQSLVWDLLVPGNHEGFWGVWTPWLVCSGKYPSTHLMTRWWTNFVTISLTLGRSGWYVSTNGSFVPTFHNVPTNLIANIIKTRRTLMRIQCLLRQKSKWAWPANTTITHCRPTHGTVSTNSHKIWGRQLK